MSALISASSQASSQDADKGAPAEPRCKPNMKVVDASRRVAASNGNSKPTDVKSVGGLKSKVLGIHQHDVSCAS